MGQDTLHQRHDAHHYRFTGQRQESGLGGTEGGYATGLYFYQSRWYDPYLNRWLQPDTIVPEPGNPQSFNRYSFVLNNPVKYTDPTGHRECDIDCQLANEPVDPYAIHLGEACGGCAPPPDVIGMEEAWAGLELVASIANEPLDWFITGSHCLAGDCSPIALLGLLPLIPSGLARHADNIIDAIPRGLRSADAFKAFGETLRGGLSAAGYDDVVIAFRGSSVTGVSYRSGKPFDVGRVSDYDIALASPTLLAKANELGIALRSGGTRTGPLGAEDLDKLGLTALAAQLTQTAGRRVSFMIYDKLETVLQRGPTIVVP